MLQSRLQKRIRHLGLDSYEEYARYVLSPERMEEELPHLINAVTTNKTDFFREPRHYDVLLHQVLPSLVDLRSGIASRHAIAESR